MKTKKSLWMASLMVAALPLTVAACHDDASANQMPPGEMTSRQAQASLADVSVGHQVGADGSIAGDQKGNNFTIGQPVMVALTIGKAPVGTPVHVDWVGPNGDSLGGDDKTVSKGQHTMDFVKQTSGWAKGDYHADLSVGGQKVDTERFAIVDPNSGSGSDSDAATNGSAGSGAAPSQPQP